MNPDELVTSQAPLVNLKVLSRSSGDWVLSKGGHGIGSGA